MTGDAQDRAICLDLDATLVTSPLFTMVASAVDMVEEIEVLTRATDAGDLPFARSLRLRCRILEDVPVSEAARRVAVAPLDPDVLACIQAKPGRAHLISEVPGPWLSDFADRLGLEVHASQATVADDRIHEITEVVDKGAIVRELKERYGQVVVVGSSIGDLPMLEAGDVRVAFGANVPMPVRSLADYWVTGGRALWQLLRPL